MIEGRPSVTAAWVCLMASMRWCYDDPKGLRQANLMRSISRQDMPLVFWIISQFILCNKFVTKSFIFFLEACNSINPVNFINMRKDFMSKQVTKFLNDNRNEKELQVIVLAAGYDLLALTLAELHPHVSFIEIDHPSTGAVKLAALRKLLNEKNSGSNSLPRNLHFCHREIGQKCTIRDALANSDLHVYDKGIPTAIVMEGLSYYLTEMENIQVYNELGRHFGCVGSVVAFDFFELDKFGSPTTSKMMGSFSTLASIFKHAVNSFGEPFKWGLAPENVNAFFKDTCWEPIPAKLTYNNCDEGTFESAIMMDILYATSLKWRKKE